MRGFSRVDESNRWLRCHPCFAKYNAEILEVKDLTSLRHTTSTSCLCHRSSVGVGDLGKRTSVTTKSCVYHAMCVLQVADGELTNLPMACNANIMLTRGNSDKKKPFEDAMSLLPVSPILYSCIPNSEIDVYQNNSFKPLHSLHLGVSKLLKIVVAEQLRSE